MNVLPTKIPENKNMDSYALDQFMHQLFKTKNPLISGFNNLS
jgi:hypothetical protein